MGCQTWVIGGPKFTWNNGREGVDFTKERLDRVVANWGWCELHNEVEVVVGVSLCSNHAPISMLLKNNIVGRKGPRLFRFEAGWDLHAKCRDIIAHLWEGNLHHADLWHMMSCKMEKCKKSLQRWQREELERSARSFEEQCQKLAVLQGAENFPDVGKTFVLQNVLKIRMEQEALKWR